MDVQQIIQETLKTLPSDIRQAITTIDLRSKFKAITTKHGLLIDQSGSLQNETLLVMIGLRPTSDFVENLKKALEVSRGEAQAIADDVNKEIFHSIRESLEKIQIQEEEEESKPKTFVTMPKPIPPTIQPKTVEEAGQFTIENPPVGTTQYNEKKLNKDVVLKNIEDTEVPLVDHLLTTPLTTTPKVEEKKESKPYTIDPYREAL